MISTIAFVSILASAFLHALWNAVVRMRPDPGEAMAAGVIVSGFVAIPGLIWFGPPAFASWPWLIAGVVINTIGIRLAMTAYRIAPYGLVYPVMRAGIPLLALPIAILLFHEWPTTSAAIGVLLISASLVSLALIARRSGKAELRGLALALFASACGAGYVACDGMGVRLSGNALAYAFGVSLGNGLALALMLRAEGRDPLALLRRAWRTGLLISSMSMTSFLLYIWALVSTPIAMASALRETSVFFAMALAAFFVKEKVGPLHWAAAALAGAGVVAIRLA